MVSEPWGLPQGRHLRGGKPGRDEELEAGAAQGRGGNEDVAAMGARDAPEDGKPQAEALPSGTGLRAAKEGVEDALAVLACDPGSPVLHHEIGRASCRERV